MYKRIVVPVLLLSTLLAAGSAWAQGEKPAQSPSSSNTAKKKKSSAGKKPAAHSSSKSKQAARNHQARKKQRVSAARVRRMTRAFVASATLKPMSQQLIEARTTTRLRRGRELRPPASVQRCRGHGVAGDRLRAHSRQAIRPGNSRAGESQAARGRAGRLRSLLPGAGLWRNRAERQSGRHAERVRQGIGGLDLPAGGYRDSRRGPGRLRAARAKPSPIWRRIAFRPAPTSNWPSHMLT